MTAWQRVELPSPRPFTRKRIRVFAITHGAIERRLKTAPLERLHGPANPNAAQRSRTSSDQTNEYRYRGCDEIFGKGVLESSPVGIRRRTERRPRRGAPRWQARLRHRQRIRASRSIAALGTPDRGVWLRRRREPA